MSNQVTITYGSGGLGRPLAGEDHISSLLFYLTAVPSGFATDKIKEIFSVTDAEALGITNTHIGETQGTSTVTISAAGASGDTISIVVGGITIGTYTSTGGTTTNAASVLVTSINANTSTTGFTAVIASPANTFDITCPAGSGIQYNSTTPTVTVTGTAAGSATQITNGVNSEIDVIHYHISRYFDMQPKGDLYVAIYDFASTNSDYAEVTTVQNYAQGKIRQMGVFTTNTYSTAITNQLQSLATANDGYHKPLEILLQADLSATSDLTTLTSLHTLSNKNVSVLIGQDGGNVGKQLYLANGFSIGQLGACLGTVSYAKVHESIAWVEKFQIATLEDDTLAFANGDLYSDLSDGTIDALDALGYLFLKKFFGLSGSYWNNSYTAIALTSDYCFIPNNRVMHKASRNLYTTMLPNLARPLYVNRDGTVSAATIVFFKNTCESALDIMLINQELSNYAVIIDPTQNVLSTSTVKITVKLQPVGFANMIDITLQFAVTLTA